MTVLAPGWRCAIKAEAASVLKRESEANTQEDRTTHVDQGTGAESGASIEPVVAFEFVYFDASAIVGGRRRQSHSRAREGSPLGRPEGETRSDRTGMERVLDRAQDGRCKGGVGGE